MSSVIEQKIVQMTFDNKDFEKNAQTSIGTLDKLKGALNMDGATSSLGNLQKTAGAFNMEGLANAAETVASKFTMLGTMGVTALVNITNKAVDAGLQLARSLTIAPISQGFNEYELKMGSIQTIMAGTGESLDTVNKYLNELNTYSDKTIYSFSDMTQNIGKFTNAGVKLEDAVLAIKGVANAAAVSGANTNEASRAMYNFAQALSSGYVKLIDWKSIENANMATVEFKQQLLDTALAMGTVVKEGDMYVTTTTNAQGKVSDLFNATRGFNDALANQWMTTEVLTQALSNYSIDLDSMSEAEKQAWRDQLVSIGYTEQQIANIEKLNAKAYASATEIKTWSMLIDTLKEAVGSGWAATWEIIFGDFEEAKSLWTAIYNLMDPLISKTAEARNQILQIWKSAGGRNDLIQGFVDLVDSIKRIIQPLKDAFNDVFPSNNVAKAIGLYDLTKGFANLTATLKNMPMGEYLELMGNLRSVFRGILSVFDILWQAVSAVFGGIKQLISPMGSVAGSALGAAASFGDWVYNLSNVIEESGIFTTVVQKIVDVIKVVIDIVGKVVEKFKELVGPIKDKIVAFFDTIPDRFAAFKEKIQPLIDKLQEFKDKIVDTFNGNYQGGKITAVLETIWGVMKKVVDVAAHFGSALKDAFVWLVDHINFDALIATFSSLGKVLEFVLDIILKVGKVIGDFIAQIADSLVDGGLGAGIDLVNGGLLAALLISAKKFIDEGKDVFKGIGDIIGGLGDTLSAFQKKLEAEALLTIAEAIGILAASLWVLASIDQDQLTSAIMGMTAAFSELMIFTKMLSGNTSTGFFGKVGSFLDSKTLKTTATAMLEMAAAVLVLAGACKILGTMEWDELAKGLIGVGALLGMLIATSKLMKGSEMVSASVGLVLFATAVAMLSGSVKSLAELSWEELGKGLLGVITIIGALVGATKLLNGQEMMTGSVGLIAMAAAILIMAQATKSFAEMSWAEMGQGLLGVVVALGAITAALKLMPNAVQLLATGVALLAVSTSMVILAGALKIMGSMSWSEFAVGIAALAASLLILAVGCTAMLAALPGAIALGVAAASIMLLAPALALLGSMDGATLGQGLLGLAAGLTAVLVAGAVATIVAPGLMALSVALLALAAASIGVGAGLMLAGAGIAAIAAGFAAMSTLTAAGASAIVTGLQIIIVGIADLFPRIAVKIGEGIVALAQVLGQNAPVLVEAAVALIGMLLVALNDLVPQIVDVAVNLLIKLLDTLNTYIPQIVDKVITLLLGIMDAIAQRIPDIVQKGVDIVIALIEGISNSALDFINRGVKLIIDFINGLADSIRTNTPLMIDAINNLIDAVLEAIAAYFDFFVEKGLQIVEKIVKGVVDNVFKVVDAMANLIKDVLAKIDEKVKDFKDAAKNLIAGFVEGIKEKATEAFEAAKDLARNVIDSVKEVFDENSPSKVFFDIGKFVDEGLANGIDHYASLAADSGKELANGTLTVVRKAIDDVNDLIDGSTDFNPVITPILDLNSLKEGTKSINDMFKDESVSIGVNGYGSGTSGASYSFVQNNYSPKALSRIDIYRQTKNQFSMMKGVR